MQKLDIRHLTKTCSKEIIPSLCGGLISPSELLASPLNEKKKKNNVTPVHIKDSTQQTENYRPISLLSIIRKDLERRVSIKLHEQSC